MKKKIFFAILVFAFAAFSVAWSYSGYGKKISENTSGTPDGKILVCRRYEEISKVIVIDSNKKSHKKEVTDWNYNNVTGELIVNEDVSDFGSSNFNDSPIFHIEGKPSEPTEFILWDFDANCGPVAVFLNGKIAVENREYVISEEKKILTIKVPTKEISSSAIIWNTPNGTSSISDITKEEMDLYAELQATWFTENAKKSLATLTEYPTLDFSECTNGDSVSAYANGEKPKIVIKKYTAAEKQKMLDEFPVNTYKSRPDANVKKLSKEVGLQINLPKKSGDYKLVFAMLIDSSLKGEKTKSAEFSYDKSDFFSLDSITIETKKSSSENAMDELDKAEYPISTETLKFKIPVIKQKAWVIGNDMENNEMSYNPEVLCIYTWIEKGTTYKIQCVESKEKETEDFLSKIF